MTKQTYNIEGLKCQHCKARVEEGLKKMNGVAMADANVEQKQITIEYDPERISIREIQEAVDDLGYELNI